MRTSFFEFPAISQNVFKILKFCRIRFQLYSRVSENDAWSFVAGVTDNTEYQYIFYVQFEARHVQLRIQKPLQFESYQPIFGIYGLAVLFSENLCLGRVGFAEWTDLKRRPETGSVGEGYPESSDPSIPMGYFGALNAIDQDYSTVWIAPSPSRFELRDNTYRVQVRVRLRDLREKQNGDIVVQDQFVSGVTLKWRYPPKVFGLYTWPSGVDLFEGENEADQKEEEFWEPYGGWYDVGQEQKEQTARAGVLTAYIKLVITQPGTVPVMGEWSALREIEVFVPDENNWAENDLRYFSNKARASPEIIDPDSGLEYEWLPIWSAGPG